jgi:hypothetical protein
MVGTQQALAQAPPGAPAPGGSGLPAAGPAGPGVFAADPVPPSSPDFCADPQKGPYQGTAFTERPAANNAFVEPKDEGCGPRHGIFASIGPLAFLRGPLGHNTIALFDQPDSKHNAAGDTNAVPASTNPVALSFADVPLDYNWGFEGSFGYRFGPDAVEVAGFLTSTHHTQVSVTNPDQLDLLFGLGPPPPGFAPNGNNLWLQADQVTASYTVQFGSLEGNYRHYFREGVEGIIGVRWIHLKEIIDIATNDGPLSPFTPATVADYNIRSRIDLVGPQVGFNLEKNLVPGFKIGFYNKDMVGADMFEVDHTSTAQGNLDGPGGSRNGTQTSAVVEIGANAQWWINDRLRIRVGYQAMWLFNVQDAEHNVNVNAGAPLGNPSDHNTIFFHGPSLDVFFQF